MYEDEMYWMEDVLKPSCYVEAMFDVDTADEAEPEYENLYATPLAA